MNGGRKQNEIFSLALGTLYLAILFGRGSHLMADENSKLQSAMGFWDTEGTLQSHCLPHDPNIILSTKVFWRSSTDSVLSAVLLLFVVRRNAELPSVAGDNCNGMIRVACRCQFTATTRKLRKKGSAVFFMAANYLDLLHLF